MASFVVSLAVFVILPRFREGMLFRYGSEFSQRVSGFSEEVALDSFGVIRLDHRRHASQLTANRGRPDLALSLILERTFL
jgi:hypothetical protein